MKQGAMPKGHAGSAYKTLHLLLVKDPFDKFVPNPSFRWCEKLGLLDVNSRQAYRMPSIRMQRTSTGVVGGVDSVQFEGRYSRKIDEMTMSCKTNGLKGTTGKQSVD